MYAQLSSSKTDFRCNTGSCEEMCPNYEVSFRIKQQLVHPLEMKDGKPHLLVKEFVRSAAGRHDPKASELRTPATLRRTVDYLLDSVLKRIDFKEGYEFVFDRLRAVRQDMVIQRVTGTDGIYILERTVTFYLLSISRMRDEKLNTFDPAMNRTHLSETLKQLLVLYEEEQNSLLRVPATSPPYDLPKLDGFIKDTLTCEECKRKGIVEQRDPVSETASHFQQGQYADFPSLSLCPQCCLSTTKSKAVLSCDAVTVLSSVICVSSTAGCDVDGNNLSGVAERASTAALVEDHRLVDCDRDHRLARCPEFVTYYLLLNVGHHEAMRYFLLLKPSIKKDRRLQFAWKFSLAVLGRNYVRAFRLLHSFDELMLNSVDHQLTGLRSIFLELMNAAYSSKACQYPLEHLARLAHCSVQQISQLLAVHGITPSLNVVTFDKSSWVST